MYGGPTEVQWHAKSRRNAGANFFVVGRDPAGVGGSDAWIAEQKKVYGIADADDLYDGNHGRYVLAMSPSMNGLGLMSFGKVYYDQVDHKMRPKDSKRSKDFLSISSTKRTASQFVDTDTSQSLLCASAAARVQPAATRHS